MATAEKDCWDKAEIIGKFVGPALIAIGAGYWGVAQVRIQTNTAQSQAELQAAAARSQADLQAATAYTQMAISILTARPGETVGDLNALREWAIGTVRDPSNPPELNDNAAKELIALSESGKFPGTEAITLPYIPEKYFDGTLTTTEEFVEQVIQSYLQEREKKEDVFPDRPSPVPDAIPLPYPSPNGDN